MTNCLMLQGTGLHSKSKSKYTISSTAFAGYFVAAMLKVTNTKELIPGVGLLLDETDLLFLGPLELV